MDINIYESINKTKANNSTIPGTTLFSKKKSCPGWQAHLGPAVLSFIEKLSSLQRVKCISLIEKRPQSVSFKERLLSLQRVKCISIIEKRPQSVSFLV